MGILLICLQELELSHLNGSDLLRDYLRGGVQVLVVNIFAAHLQLVLVLCLVPLGLLLEEGRTILGNGFSIFRGILVGVIRLDLDAIDCSLRSNLLLRDII